ncbi:extensin [Streptomyces phaeochromogenes]|uniref:extensin n=1 Tax=Streptomyces phaeochromogenes TaxID=1923 RepID=UPI0033FC58CB
MRSLTPARALTTAPAPAAPPAGPHRATPAVVPLRRPSTPGSGPAVQRRAVAPSTPVGRAVPLLSTTGSGSGSAPPVVTPRTTPQAPARASALPAAPVVQRHAAAAPAPIPVQREAGGAPQPTPARTTTAVSTVTAHGTSSRDVSASGSTSDPHKKHKTPDSDEPLPEYTPVAKGQFDPRSLTDFQLDELTHRLIGRITRLVRTELRLDRERIGKLRDPRR